MNNIFHRVAKPNEDTVTELLVNLMGVAYVRELILNFFDINFDVNFSEIKTQISYEYTGRPDIVISNMNSLVFIENKIRTNTELQPTQVSTYINEIKQSKKKNKKLIFLVPNNYIHMSTLQEKEHLNEFCLIKTWDNLIDYLYSKEIHLRSDTITDALDHLKDIIFGKRSFHNLTREELVIMLSPKELTTAHRLYPKLLRFISDVDSYLLDDLSSAFEPSDFKGFDDKDDDRIGKYIRINNKPNIFYGFNISLHEKRPELSDYFLALL